MEGAASVALDDDHTGSAGLLRVQDLDSIRRAFVRRGGAPHDSDDLATNLVSVPKRKLRILHTSAYVSIRQHTSASVSIRQHDSDDLATNFIRVPKRKLSILRARANTRWKKKITPLSYIYIYSPPSLIFPTCGRAKTNGAVTSRMWEYMSLVTRSMLRGPASLSSTSAAHRGLVSSIEAQRFS
jgi:hypothetical protein